MARQGLPHQAVDPIGGQNQVGPGHGLQVAHLVLEVQPHSQLLAAILEDAQQCPPGQAAEAVAGGADRLAAVTDDDVVPVGEVARDLGEARRIGLLQVAQRLAGEHHPPAEGVVGAIPLVDVDLVGRVLLFHEQGEVQTGRAAADGHDAHGG